MFPQLKGVGHVVLVACYGTGKWRQSYIRSLDRARRCDEWIATHCVRAGAGPAAGACWRSSSPADGVAREDCACHFAAASAHMRRCASSAGVAHSGLLARRGAAADVDGGRRRKTATPSVSLSYGP